jgi:hypothetical protein
MPQDYGAAEPIVGLARKAYNKVNPLKENKLDTSWHDEMVRKANESFRKEAEKKKVVKKPTQDTGIRRKPTSSKAYPKKRVAGKQ